MPLRNFLQQLIHTEDLRKVTSTVDSDLEVAAICRREYKKEGGGQALIFDSVRHSPVRVVANLFGSRARMLNILRCVNEQEFTSRIRSVLASGKGSATQRLQQTCSAQAVTVMDMSVCCDNMLSLNDLPALRSWPGEKERYLTLALTQTLDSAQGEINLGLYRAAIKSNKQLALNFSSGSGAAEHLKAAEGRGEALPVALILGADPALIWAAAAPLAAGCSEYAFSRCLGTHEQIFSWCQTQPMSVPADAEIIIEGEIRPGARTSEGPFGNHTGQYVQRKDCPLMTVTAIRHQPRPIMPITVVGPPPNENIHLARFNEILIREMLRIDYPCITDFTMPEMTIFHGVGILAIAEILPAEVKHLIQDLWNNNPLSRSKLLILVDDDINIRDLQLSWWRVINRVDAGCIHHRAEQMIIDATGIDRNQLVNESPLLTARVNGSLYDCSPADRTDLCK